MAATSEPIVYEGDTFSLEDALRSSFKKEGWGSIDLGPTDGLPRDTQKLHYKMFVGDSPLSSAPSSAAPSPTASTTPSRAATPSLRQAVPKNDAADASRKPQPQPKTPTKVASGNLDPGPKTPTKSASKSGQPQPKSASKSPSKRKRDKRKGHSSRKKARLEEEPRMDAESYKVRESTHMNHVEPTVPLKASFDVGKDVPAASTGWVGQRDEEDRVYTIDELVNELEFRLLRWDGKTSIPIVDKNGRIFVVLVAIPEDKDWDSVQLGAFDALQDSRERCQFPPKALDHRRGAFPALNKGISFGGGQRQPGNLVHSKTNAEELEGLSQHWAFKRIAGHQSGAFANWAPKLFDLYEETMEGLCDENPNLKRNFVSSPWACAAFNFGPCTECAKHRDHANLPCGWCGITALGRFDPTKGGHIVLWELGLVIEFPPGATILIPSAALSHSNTPIRPQAGEERCSFTQFSAGGLFRWAAHGFQKETDYFKDMEEEDLEEERLQAAERKAWGLEYFSTLTELKQRAL